VAKDLRVSFLLDFYGDMLTDTQREVVDAYYNEDLSLAEIAQDRDITRQGVRDAIKRAEQQLLEMEDRLGLARRFQEIQKALTLICDCALNIQDLNEQNGQVAGIDENVGKILECAQEISVEA
jgi:predicted DNA-binding protein YlxM (UPF0122 family)